jgi:hypothetical protein
MRRERAKRTQDVMKQHLVRFGAVAGLLFVSSLLRYTPDARGRRRRTLRTSLSFRSETSW